MAKKRSKKTIKLQFGEITSNSPSMSFGVDVGTTTESDSKKYFYEKARCSCNGDNSRCSKCEGTGYYIKKMTDEFLRANARVNPTRSVGSVSEETAFSSDGRGGGYGIREGGRFASSPLSEDSE